MADPDQTASESPATYRDQRKEVRGKGKNRSDHGSYLFVARAYREDVGRAQLEGRAVYLSIYLSIYCLLYRAYREDVGRAQLEGRAPERAHVLGRLGVVHADGEEARVRCRRALCCAPCRALGRALCRALC